LGLLEEDRTQRRSHRLTRLAWYQYNDGRQPSNRHCGTGIGPDRDIIGSWRNVHEHCASLPTVPPGRARACRGNCRLFDTGRRNVARDGLSAGAEWIRTFSSALDRQRFRGFVRVGPIYRRTGHLTSAGLGIPIELSGGGPRSRHSPPGSGGAIHRRAVGGASAWRNQRFESVPLQQRVQRTSLSGRIPSEN